jgi:hypothetical protein
MVPENTLILRIRIPNTANCLCVQANNHEEALRMFQEALAVDKHNQSYRGLLKQAKLQLAKATKKDFYGRAF